MYRSSKFHRLSSPAVKVKTKNKEQIEINGRFYFKWDGFVFNKIQSKFFFAFISHFDRRRIKNWFFLFWFITHSYENTANLHVKPSYLSCFSKNSTFTFTWICLKWISIEEVQQSNTLCFYSTVKNIFEQKWNDRWFNWNYFVENSIRIIGCEKKYAKNDIGWKQKQQISNEANEGVKMM